MEIQARCFESTLEPATLGQLIKRDKHYFVPDYQRGYRWDSLQVKALLRDMLEFYNGPYRNSAKECYCLQPIVISPSNIPSQQGFEIIDGQQRLITLLILFKALGSNCYDIEFPQRPKSTAFLKELTGNRNPDVGAINPDFHFMSQCYDIVRDWVKRQQELDEDDNFNMSMVTMLKTRVKVIRYEVELPKVEDKIAIFNRLNIGKIELNDAELIKAWLLNYSKTETSERENLLRQSEIARLWDEMELAFRNRNILGFLNVSTKDDEYLAASNLLYIFRKIAGKTKSKDYTTFLALEQRVADAVAKTDPNAQINVAHTETEKIWDEARLWFATLMSWLDDFELYHFIGYILAARISTVDSLMNKLTDERLGKQDFKEYLKGLIYEDKDKYDIDTLSYNTTDNKVIERVLLLFNVLSAMEMPDETSIRFPFHLYNKPGTKWTLEHIYAQQSEEPMKNEVYIQQYLTDTLAQLKTIPTLDLAVSEKGADQDETSAIEELSVEQRHQIYTDVIATFKALKDKKLTTDDIEQFNEARRKLMRIFNVASPSVHPLDNIALIRQSENSALSNNIFPVKRAMVLNFLKDKSRFIPLCTVNVFTKIYSAPSTRIYEWGAPDREKYLEEIKRVLSITDKWTKKN